MKTRNLGIDILCCLGVMLLLGVQYMDSIGFMEVPVSSYMTALPVAARWFCLSGAMLLSAGTGYVLSSKKLTPGYFKIFIRLIYVYLLCSLCAVAMRVAVLQEAFTPLEMVQSLLHFTATDTGRFAGMYFALLLAAPFLNAALHGLKTQKACLAFLVITAAVSTLQPMLLIHDLYLIPEWCKGLFPVAAYIGGAWIRRFTKKKHVVLCLLALAALCAMQTFIVMAVSLPLGVLYCPQLDSMAGLPCLLTALCLVGAFHSKKNGSGSAHRFFAGAAGGAVAALLLGDPLIDCMLPALVERFPELGQILWAGYGVIPVLFILCCVCGLMMQLPLFAVRSFLREEDAEEEEEEQPRQRGRRSRSEVVVPERTHTQPAAAGRERNSRHTILVPVSQPESAVQMTQPAEEKPPGVHEVALPEPPEDVLPEEYDEDAYDEESYDPPAAPEISHTAKLYIPRSQAAASRREMSVEDILGMPEKKEVSGSTSESINELLERLSR